VDQPVFGGIIRYNIAPRDYHGTNDGFINGVYISINSLKEVDMKTG